MGIKIFGISILYYKQLKKEKIYNPMDGKDYIEFIKHTLLIRSKKTSRFVQWYKYN